MPGTEPAQGALLGWPEPAPLTVVQLVGAGAGARWTRKVTALVRTSAQVSVKVKVAIISTHRRGRSGGRGAVAAAGAGGRRR
ncbi:MAG: hypothetical protein ABSE77_19040 [Acidimicrobiales bacterium]